jgi:hypothetical protein
LVTEDGTTIRALGVVRLVTASELGVTTLAKVGTEIEGLTWECAELGPLLPQGLGERLAGVDLGWAQLDDQQGDGRSRARRR